MWLLIWLLATSGLASPTTAGTSAAAVDVHVVLLDNGRTAALADRVGRAALRCIRCSAGTLVRWGGR